MVPAGDKAANMETFPGKLGHLVSQAKTACLGFQTSDLSLVLRAPMAAEISPNWTMLTNEDIDSTLTLFIQCTLTKDLFFLLIPQILYFCLNTLSTSTFFPLPSH